MVVDYENHANKKSDSARRNFDGYFLLRVPEKLVSTCHCHTFEQSSPNVTGTMWILLEATTLCYSFAIGSQESLLIIRNTQALGLI